jgi:hypothetical protein
MAKIKKEGVLATQMLALVDVEVLIKISVGTLCKMTLIGGIACLKIS